MKKFILSFLSAALLIYFNFEAYNPVQNAYNSLYEKKEYIKDETVYVNLDANGKTNKINIVNHLVLDGEGIYTDYGNYSNIKNLTDSTAPDINENKISWVLSGELKHFYYQGTVTNTELPWNIGIKYFLDNEEIDPANLAGSAGNMELIIECVSNKSANKYFRDNFSMQLQIPLDMEKCFNISQKGGISVITGKTYTVSYTVMAGEDKNMAISFSGLDFEFEGITASVVFADMSSYANLDEFTEGITRLGSGAKELVIGTNSLKNGLTKLSEKADGLTQAIGSISSDVSDLYHDLNQTSSKTKILPEQTNELVKASAKVKAVLSNVNSSGLKLTEAYSQLMQSIGTNFISDEDMEALTLLSAFSESEAPDIALLGQSASTLLDAFTQISELSKGLGEIEKGLKSYTNGVSQINTSYGEIYSGISRIPSSLQGLSQSLNELSSAAKKTSTGISQYTKGINSFASQITALPKEAQKLTEGQIKLSEGINEAAKKISSLSGKGEAPDPVSFANETAKAPKSVQFIIKSASLKKESKHENNNNTAEKSGFWQRFLSLFIK